MFEAVAEERAGIGGGGKPPKEKKPLPEWVFANQEGKPPDMHNVKPPRLPSCSGKGGIAPNA
jgi:hypothetical protein